MRVAAIVVVEPEDGVFALVQAGAGVEVERLIRVRYAQCNQSLWRDAVYRVQPGVVDEVIVREIAVLESANREDRVLPTRRLRYRATRRLHFAAGLLSILLTPDYVVAPMMRLFSDDSFDSTFESPKLPQLTITRSSRESSSLRTSIFLMCLQFWIFSFRN